MRIWKIGLVIIIVLVLCIPTFFIYTRFGLDTYEMNGNTLKFRNSLYVLDELMSPYQDGKDLGKTIGIAVEGERTMTDYIWPFWIIEFKNDKEHQRIFVNGLMGSGGVYKKVD